MKTTITRAPRGMNQREVKIADIKIPDLWSVAMSFKKESEEREMILETWHLCHDLLEHIKDNTNPLIERLNILKDKSEKGE